MEPAPSIDFVVSAASPPAEIVIVPEPEAEFLAGALSGFAPDPGRYLFLIARPARSAATR
jgi:hypothetical protein